jgi:hypothetical protein
MNLAAHDIVVAMVTSSLKNLIPFALIPISVTTRLNKKMTNFFFFLKKHYPQQVDCHNSMAILQYATNPCSNLIDNIIYLTELHAYSLIHQSSYLLQ